MAKQVFTAGQILEAADLTALQANDYNWTVDTKTDSYVLVAGDAGKRIVMNAATAKTITVNNSIFTAGDTVWIHNIGTGSCTITAGTATVNTAGSLALAQWEGGALYATSASSFIFFRGGGATYGVATGGTSSSITVGGVNYTLLTFTSTGTLTVTKAGLFDVLLCAAGGGGGGVPQGNNNGGGGGAGGMVLSQIYLSANATITIGAGGADSTSGAGCTIGGTSPSTTVANISALGGGHGGYRVNDNSTRPSSGGSGGGGGGAQSPGTIGAISIGAQGNAGGDGSGMGGGGAGGAGGNRAGGTGVDVSGFIGGSSLFKCGGGGGGNSAGTGGTGGSSVGGNGGSNGNGVAAGANTASGGGGGGSVGTSTGGAGGSGIVYVRFK